MLSPPTSCETEQQRMLSRRAEPAAHIERTARDSSTVLMLSHSASCDTEQHEERASRDPDVAHAHQHPATHHHDPASPGTTSASADDFVRRPSDMGLRCKLDLMNASPFEIARSEAFNIERTASDASTVFMHSRRASCSSCVAEQHEERASSDPNVAHALTVLRLYSLQLHPHSGASAISARDDHAASPHQHPASPAHVEGLGDARSVDVA
ncbi:hypothetical protein T484DRAFT_3633550 [Baffinella frigidus]|nr:hypothetical protein T484DRAFT_3633550 [Cryptophyta sp. CCMP2293]